MFPTVCILMVPDGGEKKRCTDNILFDPVIYFTKECRLGLDKKTFFKIKGTCEYSRLLY